MATTSVGKCLKKWRGERSQKEAAEIFGISKGFYQTLETGVADPSFKTLLKIKEITELTWSEIFGESDATGHAVKVRIEDLIGEPVIFIREKDYKEIREVFDYFKKADERDQQIIVSILSKYKDTPPLTERQKKLNDLADQIKAYKENHLQQQLPTAKRRIK